MLRSVIRGLFILLILLGALGAGIAWLGGHPPPNAPRPVAAGSAPAPMPTAPSATPGGIATPFGDALFRWRCTTGLKEAIGERSDWPLDRLAALCLCAADRLREDGPRDIIVGAGDVAASLEAAEARLCRR